MLPPTIYPSSLFPACTLILLPILLNVLLLRYSGITAHPQGVFLAGLCDMVDSRRPTLGLLQTRHGALPMVSATTVFSSGETGPQLSRGMEMRPSGVGCGASMRAYSVPDALGVLLRMPCLPRIPFLPDLITQCSATHRTPIGPPEERTFPWWDVRPTGECDTGHPWLTVALRPHLAGERAW